MLLSFLPIHLFPMPYTYNQDSANLGKLPLS